MRIANESPHIFIIVRDHFPTIYWNSVQKEKGEEKSLLNNLAHSYSASLMA